MNSEVIVGYRRYIELVADLTPGKRVVSSGMMKETERCRVALEIAGDGQHVSLISSGDPGVYAMAGLALEIVEAEGFDTKIEIVPGVSAASAAAARLGAPLMLDYACISLSDLLVPWETIRQRLEAVIAADLVVALYNPRSKKRLAQLDEAVEIFRKHRPGSTPVGIGTAVSTDEEQIVLTDLDHVIDEKIGMRSVLIVGNRSSRRFDRWFITPRGYRV